MSNAQMWFEMPAAGGHSPDEPPRPPFECEGEATYVYRGALVYARFADPRDEIEAEKVPGSRRLADEELHELAADMPFPYLDWLSSGPGGGHQDPGYVGVGDVVSWLLRKAGFSECGGCRKRKGWLNRIPVWPKRARKDSPFRN